jgi:hypothetical protein
MAKKRRTTSEPARAIAAATKSTATQPRPAFKLPKNTLSQLPEVEREGAGESLWKKANGKCSLCGEPLSIDHQNSIVADHQSPVIAGGKWVLSNLYLAHRTCNASRQDLPLEVARPLVKLRKLAEDRQITFDDVLDRFVDGESRQLIQFEYDPNGPQPERATIHFGPRSSIVNIYRDPATNIRYFFAEVPVRFLHNDVGIQPRSIMHTHVRRLAIDFRERPVHEPSNCRLDSASKKLLQFDGQHKSTAQILINRDTVPVKVYIDPDVAMIQELVIKIQQEIKKQPLTRSETLSKISDVVRPFLDQYAPPPGTIRSERGLIESQTQPDRKKVKKLYLEELIRLVLSDEENKLTAALLHHDKNRPRVTTDKVLINRVISPLVSNVLLSSDMDNDPIRDIERRNAVFILNLIAEAMLPLDWHRDETRRQRATNFFYQGAIGWWMGELLEPTIRYVLQRVKGPLLHQNLSQECKDSLSSAIRHICGWDLWSTTDPDHLRALRSNTVDNVKNAFPKHTAQEVLKALARD